MAELEHRYDVVFLFDVANNAANDRLENSNLALLKHEKNLGLISNLALKRAIGDYTERTRSREPRFNILVQEGPEAQAGEEEAPILSARSQAMTAPEDVRNLTRFLCGNFFDVRAFGAVLGEGSNAVQIRGPVQMTFATAIDEIVDLEPAGKVDAERHQTYGLFRAHFFINPSLAAKTGFDQADLNHLFKALAAMFDNRQGVGDGKITARRIVAFRHSSGLGNANAHALFERVTIHRAGPADAPARGFEDYQMTISQQGLPDGIEVMEIACSAKEPAVISPDLRAKLNLVSMRDRLGISKRPAEAA